MHANTGVFRFPYSYQTLTLNLNSFHRPLHSVLRGNCLSWELPPGPRPRHCLVEALSLGSDVKRAPLSVALSPAETEAFSCTSLLSIWQLIFFCRIRVCNPHFHVGIPLRPVLNTPAVQTRWLIKGILFVKQSLTPPPILYSLFLCPALKTTSSSLILTISLSPYSWRSPLSHSKWLFFTKTTEKGVRSLLELS